MLFKSRILSLLEIELNLYDTLLGVMFHLYKSLMDLNFKLMTHMSIFLSKI